MVNKSMPQAVILEDRGMLRLFGQAARSLLQGLVTVDLGGLDETRALYGTLLTPQGKFLFDFHITATADDDITLEVKADRLAELEKRLTLYRLRAPVTIEPVSPAPAVAVVFGGDAPASAGLPAEPGALRRDGGPLRFVDPRLAGLGVRVHAPEGELRDWLGANGIELGAREAFERHRIALAVPEAGSDLVVDRTILLEAGIDQLGGVSFDKGCFVGQELTARTRYRGLVKRRLVPLALDGAVVEPGFAVMAGEREAGEIRSVARDIALAMLRLDRLGEPLEAGGGRVRPAPAAWQGDLAALLQDGGRTA